MATAFYRRITGHPMAVGADMGGTTFDISIIDKGMPKTTTWGGVTEYPIKLPMVDMKTIGAGGGSIAWIDEGGVLNVGPQSAGSAPGPACYGWGGSLPDRDRRKPRRGPSQSRLFPRGAHPPLSREGAGGDRDACGAADGQLSVEEAAFSIIRIVNANMAKGIGGVSVQRGYDLREFILVPFGGAAANHAVDICCRPGHHDDRRPADGRQLLGRRAGGRRYPARLCTDGGQAASRTSAPNGSPGRSQPWRNEGIRQLKAENVNDADIVVEWSADLRYEGQSWELNTPVRRSERFRAAELAGTDRRIPHPAPAGLFVLRAQGALGVHQPQGQGDRQKPAPDRPRGTGAADAPLRGAEREAACLLHGHRIPRRFPCTNAIRLGCGSVVTGPCLVEERISTTPDPRRLDREDRSLSATS